MPHLIIVLWLFCLLLAHPLKAERVNVTIAVSPHIQETYQLWTRQQDCWRVESYSAEHSSRGALELILLCKALYLSGIDFKFEFYPSPNYTRSLYLADRRQVHLPGETIWRDEIDESKYHVTAPMIDVGEMKKGIFTIPGHPLLTSPSTAKDLRNKIGISLKHWHHDWQVLNQLTKLTMSAPSSLAVHKMIGKGRADFTLGEFNPQMEIELEQIKLVPVPNMYVSLQQSRHFIVRKGLRNSERFFHAINAGIAKLKQNGEIKKAYQKAGFYPAIIGSWQDLSAQH